MTDARVVTLEVDVDLREVHRNLGYGRSGSPRERTRRRIEELWPRATELLRPRGAIRVVEREVAARTGMPEPSDPVGVGLCTIGAELEEESRACSDRGEMLDALLLDAFGSAAAEAAADALNLYLCEHAAAHGWYAARRISPGYGRWDVRSQRELLSLLPAEEIGIRLTDGMMMVPRKSVSFAVRYRDTPGPPEEWKRCARCNLERCRYRREEDRDD
jgi:hypothetical protein